MKRFLLILSVTQITLPYSDSKIKDGFEMIIKPKIFLYINSLSVIDSQIYSKKKTIDSEEMDITHINAVCHRFLINIDCRQNDSCLLISLNYKVLVSIKCNELLGRKDEKVNKKEFTKERNYNLWISIISPLITLLALFYRRIFRKKKNSIDEEIKQCINVSFDGNNYIANVMINTSNNGSN